MFRDHPVLDAEDVAHGKAVVVRRTADVIVDDHVIAIDERALDIVHRLWGIASGPVEKRLERLAPGLHALIVLDIIRRNEAIHRG